MAESQSERSTTLFERTLTNLTTAWRDVATGAARTVGWSAPENGENDLKAVRRLMRECLEARGGEVSARGRAADLGRRYLEMDRGAKLRFLKILAREFGCEPGRVEQAIQAYRDAPDAEVRWDAEARLRQALVPPRVKLLTQFNALPDGTKFLVDLRADLLRHVHEDAHLRHLDSDLRELLRSWFDVGFLDLQQITWHSSAALLEKLMAYEAVHEIRDWNDLRNRLDSDRRCYALFHPRMPDEPLAFVEIALTRKMAASVQALLDEEAPSDDPQQAKAAIFYSISNTQKGLRGISFGDYLIKQVVGRLAVELPQIETFATLSPVPGFRDWLDKVEPSMVRALTDDEDRARLAECAGENDPAKAIGKLLERKNWTRDHEVTKALREPLMRLCGRYFLARREDNAPIDPVARFHLKNGARLERINWLGDVSSKGLKQSAGIMVNYRYVLDDLERNHEAYMRDGRIALGGEIRSLLRGLKDPDGTQLRRLA